LEPKHYILGLPTETSDAPLLYYIVEEFMVLILNQAFIKAIAMKVKRGIEIMNGEMKLNKTQRSSGNHPINLFLNILCRKKQISLLPFSNNCICK